MPVIVKPTRPVLLYGPTASGKSSLALDLASRIGGAIINADSQQGYACWRILTARPPVEEEARAPHFLYGHLPPQAPWSAGDWLAEATDAIERCRAHGLVPIITGGTGLYFRALTEGLAQIPPVPPGLRAAGEAELQRLGLQRFAEALARRDPDTTRQIDLTNPRRVLRAWEVLQATGMPLAHWQARTGPAVLPTGRAAAILLTPARDWLYARCEARLQTMLDEGVLDEIRAVQSLGLSDTLPAMKAVGLRELAAHLDGTMSLEEATARAAAATRRYAKRQLTWARGQMTGWTRIGETGPRRLDRALAALQT